MDGRESMVTSGSSLSSFYIQHRGVGRPGAPGPPPGLHGPHPGSGYRHHLDAGGAGFSFQHPHMGGNPHIGQGQVQGLHVETSPPVSQHAAVGGSTSATASIGMVSAAPGANAYADSKGAQESGGPSQDEQVKRKRGRPRKYKPDGAVTLGLSPSSSTPPSSSSGMVTVAGTPGSGAPSEKRARGRPPGSGKMQQLASLGKWLLGSVGTGFTPHVIIISPGEDVAARIMSFAQQGPRAICIMSATGAVSTATLHQDANSGTVIKYEGRFEILCLSGSYLVIDDGGSRTRTGGLCIALCGPDHKVIGGSVGGDLIAAGAVQVIVGSFMYAGSKKNKAKTKQDQENEEPNSPDEEGPLMTLPDDSISPHQMSGWPAMMRHMDSRSSNIDINSIRE